MQKSSPKTLKTAQKAIILRTFGAQVGLQGFIGDGDFGPTSNRISMVYLGPRCPSSLGVGPNFL